MHKPVRYYITESNNRPVVRSVEVTLRDAEPTEPNTDRMNTSSTPDSRIRLNRASLTSRLKPRRSQITDAS